MRKVTVQVVVTRCEACPFGKMTNTPSSNDSFDTIDQTLRCAAKNRVVAAYERPWVFKTLPIPEWCPFDQSPLKHR